MGKSTKTTTETQNTYDEICEIQDALKVLAVRARRVSTIKSNEALVEIASAIEVAIQESVNQARKLA